MHQIHVRLALVALCVAAPSLPAQAQGEPKPPEAGVTLDMGFVNTAGNSEVTTLNVGEKFTYRAAPWLVTQTFAAVYGRTDDVTSASQWKGGVRGDLTLSSRVSVFGQGRFERNRFAGIARRFEQALGMGAVLVDGGPQKLTAEAGASLNQQTSSATDVTETFAAGRVAATYKRMLNGKAFVTGAAEFLPNLRTTEDYRINGAAQLVAPISNAIAVKLAYEVRFDNLPEPGFRKTDRTFTAGLQVVL